MKCILHDTKISLPKPLWLCMNITSLGYDDTFVYHNKSNLKTPPNHMLLLLLLLLWWYIFTGVSVWCTPWNYLSLKLHLRGWVGTNPQPWKWIFSLMPDFLVIQWDLFTIHNQSRNSITQNGHNYLIIKNHVPFYVRKNLPIKTSLTNWKKHFSQSDSEID